jgi:hypothetical protein
LLYFVKVVSVFERFRYAASNEQTTDKSMNINTTYIIWDLIL